MRLRFASTLALALAAGITAVSAAGLTGMGLNIYGNYFSFPKANLEQVPVHKITAGKLTMTLQSTRLKDIQKAFGGTIKSQGDATWLCYHTEDANTWFISNPLGGSEFLMMVAVQVASSSIPSDCEPASDKFTTPDFGVPSLGAKTAELKTHFGAAPGSSGKVTYRADAPGGYADNAQYLGYMMKGGTVVGFGVGESSIPTAH